jgi:iron complex transport system permease protein
LKSSKSREATLAAAAALILGGAALLSLNMGATVEYDPEIFWLLRVPRTISAIAVGGGLAVAGTLVQASLANPLAEPYTIGIASAAALGAVVGSISRGHQSVGSGMMAFFFALGALLFLASWLRGSFRRSTEVLLAGVVMGFFCTSAATLVMALMDPAQWSSAMVWMLGTLGKMTLSESVASLLVITFLCIVGWVHWKPLDLMAVDETSAEAAGVEVASLRRRMLVLVALITAIAVSTAGVIGFLGLIVPHVLRRLGLRRHYPLIPVAFLSGAALLLLSDTLARVVARPSELPVGVVMAVIGAPFFLMLVRGERRVA